MRKKLLATLAVIAVLGLVGCQNNYTPEDSDEAQKREEKVEVEETSDLPETDTPTPTPIVEEDIFEYEVVDNAIVITGLKEEREHIVIPSEIDGMTVTSIGEDAFSYCKNLVSIEISNSITYIGSKAFEGCENLVSIEIPNSVTYIGYYAFNSCRSLASIKIPKSVKKIGRLIGGNDLFPSCENLEVIAVEDNSYAKEWAIKDDDPVDVYYYSSSREAGVSSDQETNVSDTGTLSERVGGKLYVGDVFTLGTYEQDNYIDNGKEPIEWIVLSKSGNEYLCISKYVLDAQPFSVESTGILNNWKGSYMQDWLNNTFYNEAFSDIDKVNLVEMNTSYNGWNDKDDLKIDRITSYGDYVRLIKWGELDEHPGCVKITEYVKMHRFSYNHSYHDYVDDGTREHELCSDNWGMMTFNADLVEYTLNMDEYFKGWGGHYDTYLAKDVAIYRHEETSSLDGNARVADRLIGVRPVICIDLSK